MTTSKEVLAHFHKRHGEHVGGLGHEFADFRRVPSGVFELDLATGGGWVSNAVNIVYGGESSGKTSLVLYSVAAYQRSQAAKKAASRNKAVYVDIENAVTRPFAEFWGVCWEDLILLKPEYAEMAIDMVQAMLEARDVGFVGVDSTAALTKMASKEMTKSAEDGERQGGGGLLGARLISKIVWAMSNQQHKHGRFPTIVLVNQPRVDMSKTYAAERLPGGVNQNFAAMLKLKLWGKKVHDDKIHKARPCRLEVQGTVVKYRVPILAERFKYRMLLEPQKGLPKGTVDDFPTIKEYLEAAGALEKKGAKWVFREAEYPNLVALRDALRGDRKLMREARKVALAFAEGA